MPLFGAKPLPLTSYGYQPPRRATAHGWKCTNYDCGQAQHEPVQRWPVCCRSCGSRADPLLDQPWAHEAEGIELSWEVSHHPERGGGFAQERLLDWNLKDALLCGNAPAAQAARAAIHSHAAQRTRADRWWSPSYVFYGPVMDALAADDIDGAADDLCVWLGLSNGDNAEEDNRNRTNARTVIDAADKFFASADGRAHPRAQEIRQACLRVAAGAFRVLNREQQAAITRMARV
jgi:hypothetical protein